MECASQHHHKHHNKTVSQRARRAPVWLMAPVVLACGIFCVPNFGAPVFPRRLPDQAASPSPGRKLAEKDVQIGKFYFRIGKYEASISRFQDAVTHDPAWAAPHEWLGEAFEKKNDPQRALTEYREYLKIAPRAKDARKIERRVEKLAREVKEQTASAD